MRLSAFQAAGARNEDFSELQTESVCGHETAAAIGSVKPQEVKLRTSVRGSVAVAVHTV